jgi:hypothetical protein
MSGDFYCRAFGENIFEVEKPLIKKGIGYDMIPDFIKRSNIYSANNLGKLGNIENIPSEKDVSDYIDEVKRSTVIGSETLSSTFDEYQNQKNFYKMLQLILIDSGLNESAKKILLEKTVKVALETNHAEIAWKIALYAGRE